MTVLKKYAHISVFFICILLVLAGWVLPLKKQDITFDKQHVDMVVSGQSVPLMLEIARTPIQWEQGLMHRSQLPQGVDGMLFLFGGDDERFMWMKDTLMPLDMVFFNAKGQAVHVVKNTVPESTDIITSQVPAAMVLELPAGKVDEYGIQTGDMIHAPF
jgi:uncharacterized protein